MKRRVLFVCHGNICRSAMAEYICKKLRPEICCESAAVSYEEEGNDMYPKARRCLERHGVSYGRHRARRIQKKDYDRFDEIYVMDGYNMSNILRIMDDPEDKIRKLRPYDIEDPWYTDNFDKVFEQIEEGIKKL
ncbi:MAG: low molecular weight phosphotyrosine protein phosphatase [Erysipelotrichaceae bacterium]|nr:low molecular weight phosphotyrosine protein phosphatase [Erysipelotrichaceae bacterium]